MTRINCIPVQELTNKHLMAEYYELPRVFTLAQAAFNRDDIKNIPCEYTLGKGHVRFFYDKIGFLHDRYNDLYIELVNRNYKLNTYKFNQIIKTVLLLPNSLYNDWTPTKDAQTINRKRINKRNLTKL